MKTIKRISLATILVAAFMLMLLAALILPHSASAAEMAQADIEAIIADTAAYLRAAVTAPGIGQTGGDWTIIALMRSAGAETDDYIRNYYYKAADELEATDGVLSTVKYSEYSRVALAMTSIGADPRDIEGYDMLAPLTDFNATVYQGINGPIFALIAFNAVSVDYETISELYISYILSKQLSDGGFTLSGAVSDPDTTAMALTALSRYSERAEVRDAVNRALDRLSGLQRSTGGFTSFTSTNSESVAQVIIALSSLGISIDDHRFVKEGNSLLDNLLTYYEPGQGFEHEYGNGASIMATEQALCALAALRRMQSGEAALFDMSDSPEFHPGAPGGAQPARHPDVNVPAVSVSAPAFGDINGHENERAISALFEREIVTGYSPDSFEPDRTVSRAEFAAIIVRALGLSPGDASVSFVDVPAGSWFYDFARAACGYGIILGRSPDEFDPTGLITRQEAALMVMRAASLCGLKAELDETAIRNILSPFIDYKTAAPWAAEALAFCCYYNIIDDSGISLGPSEDMLRGGTAEMAYRMLEKAKLIG